ncbi:MAG: TlyA family RNA methyltransferase [Clostridia bacterium]|nr:TlyA family RNA methyltransferase [Clostridia bacterium]
MVYLSKKERLDTLLVMSGKAQSREKAKALIMSGIVYINNQKCDKPGTTYPVDCEIEIRGSQNPYVSRGGLKLEKAMKKYPIILSDKVCMDIGASTGGFTDCMLQNRAKKVYAVDVGYGQLHWKLRNDKRVVNYERTNIRYLEEDKVTEKIDFAVIDVSFISLKICLPKVKNFLADNAQMVCLIKPQFEAGRENIGKNGVVRDEKVHMDVINDIIEFIISIGFSVLGIDFSPIKGPKGNIEYLAYIERSSEPENKSGVDIKELVKASHIKLDTKNT